MASSKVVSSSYDIAELASIIVHRIQSVIDTIRDSGGLLLLPVVDAPTGIPWQHEQQQEIRGGGFSPMTMTNTTTTTTTTVKGEEVENNNRRRSNDETMATAKRNGILMLQDIHSNVQAMMKNTLLVFFVQNGSNNNNNNNNNNDTNDNSCIMRWYNETFLQDDNDDEDNRKQEQHQDVVIVLVNGILLPLLTALVYCYTILDRISTDSTTDSNTFILSATTQQQHDSSLMNRTTNKLLHPPPQQQQQQQNYTSSSSRPCPYPKPSPVLAIGMLSIRNYTDIACMVELTICCTILPYLDPYIGYNIHDRVKYCLPKSLAGRISKHCLVYYWGQCNTSTISSLYHHKSPVNHDHPMKKNVIVLDGTTMSSSSSSSSSFSYNHHRIQQLQFAVIIVGQLILLDRFRPMLLPRHIMDLYAAILQIEQLQQQQSMNNNTKNIIEGMIDSDIYRIVSHRLIPLLRRNNDQLHSTSTTTTSQSSCEIDTFVQAKTYQKLLLHGSCTPLWLRQCIANRLTHLATYDLLALIQGFVHTVPDDSITTTTAAIRLAHALTCEKTNDIPYCIALCDQIWALLDSILLEKYNTLTHLSQCGYQHHDQTTVITLDIILQHIPMNIRNAHILHPIKAALEQNNSGGDANHQHHHHHVIRTIRRWGLFLLATPSRVDPTFLTHLMLIPLSDNSTTTSCMGNIPTILSLCLSLASTSSILHSSVKEDAKLVLALFINSMQSKGTLIHSKGMNSKVEARDVLAIALVYALSLTQWDMQGMDFLLDSIDTSRSSSIDAGYVTISSIGSTPVNHENCNQPPYTMEQMATKINDRLLVLMQILGCSSINHQDSSTITSTPDSNSILSRIFRILLVLYFCHHTFTSSSGVKHFPLLLQAQSLAFVSLVCIPSLCEAAAIESLLSSDDDIADVLILMRLVFSMTVQLKETDPERVEDHNGSLLDEKLIGACNVISSILQVSEVSLWSPDIQSNDDGEELLLSLSSILLSMLTGILEMGSKDRSKNEETLLISMLTILRPLTDLSEGGRAMAYRAQYSEIATVASHVCALIAVRGAVPMHTHPQVDNQDILSVRVKTFFDNVAEAEVDLNSLEPPIRARGVVKLRHLAMALVTVENGRDEPRLLFEGNDNIQACMERLLTVSVSALNDPESYVFLAAIHTIVSIGEIDPKTVIPMIASAVSMGQLQAGVSLSIPLSSEQRVKLTEALISIIRRKPSIQEYFPFLIRALTYGPWEEIRLTNTSEGKAIQQQTLDYLVYGHGNGTTDDMMWDQRYMRANTGGPVFLSEENDLAHAARVNAIAELVAVSHPSVVARYASIILQCSLEALRFDTSRPVRRSGALLARELYAAVVCELDEFLNGSQIKGFDMTLACAMVAAGEEVLIAALKRCIDGNDLLDLGQLRERFDDLAVRTRCEEAISLQHRAEEGGAFTVGKMVLAIDRVEHESPLVRVLTLSSQQKGKINDLTEDTETLFCGL